MLNKIPTSPDIASLIARLLAGSIMLTHGIPKLENLLTGRIDFADPLGLGEGFTLVLAVLAEVFCSIMVILGFKSRWASIPLIIVMLVAAFIVHASDPFSKKEFPLLYLGLFLVVFFLGSGNYSLDKLFGKYKK